MQQIEGLTNEIEQIRKEKQELGSIIDMYKNKEKDYENIIEEMRSNSSKNMELYKQSSEETNKLKEQIQQLKV